jgi:membrane protein insertase Oxa1/YidC/SpoIIIJ
LLPFLNFYLIVHFQIIPDPTLVLPILVGAGFLLGTEISVLQFYDKKLPNVTKAAKQLAVRNILWRGVALGLAYVAANGPSAVALYWMLSGWSAVAMNLILMSPKVRRWARIPLHKTEEQNPYSKLLANFQLRFKHFVHKFSFKKTQ